MRRRRERKLPLIQVLSLALALLLAVAIVGKKVAAQPAAKGNAAPSGSAASRAGEDLKNPFAQDAKPSMKGGRAPDAKAGTKAGDANDAKKDEVKTADAKAGDAKKDDAKAGDAKKDDGDKKDDDGPISYAEVQTDADFPSSMSAEEKLAIGTGKVPIHRDGPYKSPFAHPRFGGAATAKVGFVLVTMREYDIQHGSFEADFFLSLTSDKPMGPIALAFPNASEMNETVLADTPTFKLYRYDGKFESPVDLRKYPFDTQELTIEVEDKKAGVDQLIFEPYKERTSLDEGFELPGWLVASVGGRAYKHRYPPRFDRDDLYVSRYKFTLSIDRFVTSAAFSVFLPAYVIVLISLFGLWVPPDELEVRSNAGAPMLAAAVFFHYSLTQSLPAVGYLTRADKLMMGVYLSLLLNMASTWAFLLVGEEKVEHLFKWFRAWVPPLTAALMAAATLL